LKARQLKAFPSLTRSNKLTLGGKAGGLRSVNSDNRSEPKAAYERLTEMESTVSGNSLDQDMQKLSLATKALSSRPSLYQ